MKRVTALLLLMACSAHAEQAPAWEGYWSTNASWCSRAGDVGEDTPVWFGRDGFYAIEWSCDVTKVQPTGYLRSWTISATCMDAGYEYEQSQIFLLTQEDQLLIIDDTGVTSNLVRCAKRETEE